MKTSSYTELLKHLRELFPYATDIRIEVDTTSADIDNMQLDPGTSFVQVTAPATGHVMVTTPYGTIKVNNNVLHP